MLKKLRERMANDEGGFTLVELLVVMLILGLLAAIAIPSFFNQRDKARDAEAKTDARTAQTAMETYATDNDGAYTNATVAILRGIEPTLTNAAINLPAAATATTYQVQATASGTNTTFTIQRTDTGQFVYTCSAPNKGGCPSDSNWGN